MATDRLTCRGTWPLTVKHAGEHGDAREEALVLVEHPAHDAAGAGLQPRAEHRQSRRLAGQQVLQHRRHLVEGRALLPLPRQHRRGAPQVAETGNQGDTWSTDCYLPSETGGYLVN